MKCKYRKTIAQAAISYMDRAQEMKLNILQVMHMLTAAWNAVKSKTIANYVKITRFKCSNSIKTATNAKIINEED
jgi:hypothetical protein